MSYMIEVLSRDEILSTVNPILVQKMDNMLTRGLVTLEDYKTTIPTVEKSIDRLEIYDLYMANIYAESAKEEIRFPVDMEKYSYPWMRTMPTYSTYYEEAELVFSDMHAICKKMGERKIKLRGKKDDSYDEREKNKMMENTLEKIKGLLQAHKYQDKEFYSKLYDKYDSMRGYDALKILKKYDFNYVDEDKQSYYLFEMLIIFVFKMRIQKTKAKEQEKMLLTSKKNIESIRLKDTLGNNQKILDLIDLSLGETEELNKINKNQISAYVAKVFKNFYNFTEENIKGVMRFMLTDTGDNTSFLNHFYPDITIQKKIVNGVEISKAYEKKTDILYPYILLNLDEL